MLNKKIKGGKMKKGDAKTFVLLGIFVFIGLLFMLFAKINPANPSFSGAAEAKKQEQMTKTEEPKTPEELSEKMFSDKMGEFKNIIVGLEQKDTQKFKTDTQNAFNKLADLIGEFSSTTGDNQSKVNDKIQSVKRSGEQLTLLQDEEKVANEVKKGFTSANDALKEVKSSLNCDKPEDKALCEGISKKTAEIETKIKTIDKDNQKLKTKEILADFHSLLRSMHRGISAPKNMTMIQPKDANDFSEQSFQVINKQSAKDDNSNIDKNKAKDSNDNINKDNKDNKSKNEGKNDDLTNKSQTPKSPKCGCKAD
jgi:hypothetical protein